MDRCQSSCHDICRQLACRIACQSICKDICCIIYMSECVYAHISASLFAHMPVQMLVTHVGRYVKTLSEKILETCRRYICQQKILYIFCMGETMSMSDCIPEHVSKTIKQIRSVHMACHRIHPNICTHKRSPTGFDMSDCRTVHMSDEIPAYHIRRVAFEPEYDLILSHCPGTNKL